MSAAPLARPTVPTAGDLNETAVFIRPDRDSPAWKKREERKE